MRSKVALESFPELFALTLTLSLAPPVSHSVTVERGSLRSNVFVNNLNFEKVDLCKTFTQKHVWWEFKLPVNAIGSINFDLMFNVCSKVQPELRPKGHATQNTSTNFAGPESRVFIET